MSAFRARHYLDLMRAVVLMALAGFRRRRYARSFSLCCSWSASELRWRRCAPRGRRITPTPPYLRTGQGRPAVRQPEPRHRSSGRTDPNHAGRRRHGQRCVAPRDARRQRSPTSRRQARGVAGWSCSDRSTAATSTAIARWFTRAGWFAPVTRHSSVSMSRPISVSRWEMSFLSRSGLRLPTASTAEAMVFPSASPI